MCYVIFQLFSHKNIYDDDDDYDETVRYPSIVANRLHAHTSMERNIPPAWSSPPPTDGVIDPGQQDARLLEAGEDLEEDEKPEMRLRTGIILVIVAAVVCRWLISLTVPSSNRAK